MTHLPTRSRSLGQKTPVPAVRKNRWRAWGAAIVDVSMVVIMLPFIAIIVLCLFVFARSGEAWIDAQSKPQKTTQPPTRDRQDMSPSGGYSNGSS